MSLVDGRDRDDKQKSRAKCAGRAARAEAPARRRCTRTSEMTRVFSVLDAEGEYKAGIFKTLALNVLLSLQETTQVETSENTRKADVATAEVLAEHLPKEEKKRTRLSYRVIPLSSRKTDELGRVDERIWRLYL